MAWKTYRSRLEKIIAPLELLSLLMRHEATVSHGLSGIIILTSLVLDTFFKLHPTNHRASN